MVDGDDSAVAILHNNAQNDYTIKTQLRKAWNVRYAPPYGDKPRLKASFVMSEVYLAGPAWNLLTPYVILTGDN